MYEYQFEIVFKRGALEIKGIHLNHENKHYTRLPARKSRPIMASKSRMLTFIKNIQLEALQCYLKISAVGKNIKMLLHINLDFPQLSINQGCEWLQ